MKNTLIRGIIKKSPFSKFFPILVITIIFALSFAILFHPYANAAEPENIPENNLDKSLIFDNSNILLNQFDDRKDYILTPAPTLKLALIKLDSKTIEKVFTRSTNSIHILSIAQREDLLDNESYYIQDNDEKIFTDRTAVNTLEINLHTINYKSETVKEIIQHGVERRESDSLYKGNEKIIQKGENGEKEITIKFGYANGKEISKSIVNEKVIKEPITEIKEVGTKSRPGRSSLYQHPPKSKSINGQEITYCGIINVKATSYDRNCLGCNGRGITSTGAKLKKGIIAANTRYIPYNTEFYVPGYGYGKVLDTGSLGSRHLDLGYWDYKEDKANWSTRNLNVYVLCK